MRATSNGLLAPTLVLATILVSVISPSPQVRAQALTTLYNFCSKTNCVDGQSPRAGLIQATNGDLYGTTFDGGVNNAGTVFRIAPGGLLTTIHRFCLQGTFPDCPDGDGPSGLIQTIQGDLYGTTFSGGANGAGSVFKITPAGTLTTVYSFCSQSACTDGSNPNGLVQATNGNLYGTTSQDGASNAGTVFKISLGGVLTTLYSFCSKTNCEDGRYPLAGLIQAANGDFYGTTFGGGRASGGGYGTVFKITPGGTLTTLYSFCSKTDCTDGTEPEAGLIQATNGDLYGTTAGGGANCRNLDGCGTVFRIPPEGTLTTIYSFCSRASCTDGSYPEAALLQAANGNLYGTTYSGGADGYGTAFRITEAGVLTTLHNFCAQSICAGGSNPNGLSQGTNGDLYGTTYFGGLPGGGTVFSLSAGLSPFVEARPTSGKEGAAVTILGSNMEGATRVTFNKSAAQFKIVSNSEIIATVPSGATTGPVEVTTPRGNLKSNLSFTVKP